MTGVGTLERALAELGSVVRARLRREEAKLDHPNVVGDLVGAREPFTADEAITVLLALAPHVQPDFLSGLLAEHVAEGGEFPEFGGVRGTNHRGFLPTGETAQLLVAGDDLERRLEVQQLFDSDHWFGRHHVLWLDDVPRGEPVMSGRIVLDPELVERITTGRVSTPRFSSEFPAEKIETAMTWDDLVLPRETRALVDEIENWVDHHRSLPEGAALAKRVKPGFRALFHGPPGTGKTLTATLLGQRTGRDVFRVDLSRVVSKFIGETEKNLSRLFDKAEHKDWILFFDEADALFGKRTDIRDAHDKYANQEVSYLLQRIEMFEGLVILASNQRGNVDDAFLRRVHVLVPFPVPSATERLILWGSVFDGAVGVASDVDWSDIAESYELTGSAIVNVAQRCVLAALANGVTCIDRREVEAGIMRELVKDGKVI